MGRVKFGIVIFIAIVEFLSLADSKCGCSFKGTITCSIFLFPSDSTPIGQNVTFSVELASCITLQLSVLGGSVEAAVISLLFTLAPSVNDVDVCVEMLCKLKKCPRKPQFECACVCDEEFC